MHGSLCARLALLALCCRQRGDHDSEVRQSGGGCGGCRVVLGGRARASLQAGAGSNLQSR